MKIGDIVLIPFAKKRGCIIARITSGVEYSIDTGLFWSHNNENTTVIDVYIMNGNVSAYYTGLGSATVSNIMIPTMYSFVTNGIDSHQFYVNNSRIINSTTAMSRSDTPSSVAITLASDSGGRWNNIIFYSHLLYNRVLSSTEIIQNYNALKGRFNL